MMFKGDHILSEYLLTSDLSFTLSKYNTVAKYFVN